MTVVGVIGLGTMGLGIAQVFAAAGHRVLGVDAQNPTAESLTHRLFMALAPRVEAGKLDPAARDAILSRLQLVPSLDGLAPAGLLIEAASESYEVKTRIFTHLQTILAPGAVLATNTSSLSVARIAAALREPARLVGLHFFNPAPAMRLVELIAHAGSAPDALAAARGLTEAAGKTVIDAPDRPGFIVNRCARPFYGEALAMLEEGRSPGEIDAAMVAADYRMGPFSLIDLIGADINLAATEGLLAALGGHPRYHVFDALKAQVARGALGRKARRGFVEGALPAPPPDAAEIALRIEATLINEALWLLCEGGTTPEGIDTAMTLGLNWPRGPFAMLAAHGADRIRATLAGLEARTALKGRYNPAPGLT
jgi:3-hydroxybutyryl-CoA dehydrogenase